MRVGFVLLLASMWLGCPSGSTPPPPPCGEQSELSALEAYAACNRATLATRTAGGIWHLRSRLDGDDASAVPPAPGALSLTEQSDGGLLFGAPLAERVEDGETFFVATVTQTGNQLLRVGYIGCEAQDPDHFTGFYQVCVDGALLRSGPFEAVRVQRRAGEGESQGLTLRAELPLTGAASDLYVADGGAYVPKFEGGLTVVDVSNPLTPAAVASITTPSGTRGSGGGNGDSVYVASTSEGAILFDVSNRAAPVRSGKVPTSSYPASSLSVTSDALYVFGSIAGQLLRYDLTDPAVPDATTVFVPTNASGTRKRYPQAAVELGSRAYLAANALGTLVLDFTNPETPSQLGAFANDDSSTRAIAAAVVGPQTLVFEGGGDWGGHLKVLDATDPAAIIELADVPGRPEVAMRAMVLRGTRLYVANLQDGLRVWDVATPGTPVSIGYFNTWREDDPGRGISFIDGAVGVSVPGDGHIYVAETSRGLLVLDDPP